MPDTHPEKQPFRLETESGKLLVFRQIGYAIPAQYDIVRVGEGPSLTEVTVTPVNSPPEHVTVMVSARQAGTDVIAGLIAVPPSVYEMYRRRDDGLSFTRIALSFDDTCARIIGAKLADTAIWYLSPGY